MEHLPHKINQKSVAFLSPGLGMKSWWPARLLPAAIQGADNFCVDNLYFA